MDDGDGDGVVRDERVMNNDSNLEPAGLGVRLGLFSSQLETTRDGIEDFNRMLEDTISRFRQDRRSLNPTAEGSNNVSSVRRDFLEIESEVHYGENSEVGSVNPVERGKSSKRDHTHLLARALDVDCDGKKDSGDGGDSYDCNICLDMAKDPIVTCCGHLFCWACFYQLKYVDIKTKECPVCKGEVSDSNVIPIYGNAYNKNVTELESGMKIPPRPKAHRVESVRQQYVNGRISHVLVADALRQVRMSTEQPREQDSDNVTLEQHGHQDLNNANGGSHTDLEALEVLLAEASGREDRELSERANSHYSSPMGLDNTEMLFDAEYVNFLRLLERSDSELVAGNEEDLLNFSVSDLQFMVSTPDAHPVSSARPDSSAAVAFLENPDISSVVSGNRTMPHRSSSRRRRGASRYSDSENGVSQEPRRRRLR